MHMNLGAITFLKGKSYACGCSAPSNSRTKGSPNGSTTHQYGTVQHVQDSVVDTAVRTATIRRVNVKRTRRPPLAVVALAVLISPILLQLAYGYLDPGTGSYILQLVIGGLLGGLFAIGLFWKKVIAFLKRIFDRRGHDAERKD